MYWMISRHLEQRFTVISPGAVIQLLARKVSLILSQLNSFSVTSTCLAFFCIIQKNRILNCWGEICKEWDYSSTNPNSDISFEMQCHDFERS